MSYIQEFHAECNRAIKSKGNDSGAAHFMVGFLQSELQSKLSADELKALTAKIRNLIK